MVTSDDAVTTMTFCWCALTFMAVLLCVCTCSNFVATGVLETVLFQRGVSWRWVGGLVLMMLGSLLILRRAAAVLVGPNTPPAPPQEDSMREKKSQ